MEQKIQKSKLIKRIGTFLVVILLLLCVGFITFRYFYIVTEGRMALRQAKNIKIALDMLEIEYYGKNKTIYDASKQNGLAKDVETKVNDLVGQEGEFCLHAYNIKKHEILYMTYETECIRVIYRSDREGDGWKVEYMETIFDYTDEK